ncbi:MAG: glycosyltransferase family 2 protein, partial [Clostridia bacterium]|nr:glycosyltransferase family 2 protein [Clostridia bacterium]
MKLTIVVPCYNEEKAIPIFYNEVEKILGDGSVINHEDYEYLFINDGSKDKTYEVMKELSTKDTRVKYVSFSRNFGKEAAIFAGLENAKGDYVTIMDVDLQDPPSLLPEMLSIVESGDYDCVGSRRVDRKGEPKIRSWFARKFYQLMGKISDSEVVDGARDFQMMNRKVVDAILSMGEYN